MLKSVVIAGLVLASSTLQVAAGSISDPPSDIVAQAHAAGLGQGCLGEPGTWLPGTLQIDEPAEPAGSERPMQRQPTVQDCALV